MIATEYQPLLDVMLSAARRACVEITAVYESGDFCVDLKSDQSPVTEADRRAHGVIVSTLATVAPTLPILSEEAAIPDYSQRKQWLRYWLVDPLDGTREFIRRNGEFAVSIALVENHSPVLGVVAVPVSGALYAGVKPGNESRHWWAFREDANGRRQPLDLRVPAWRKNRDDNRVKLIFSRRYNPGEPAELLSVLGKDFDPLDSCYLGSAIKFCRIAEGAADVYPCLLPTREWDTAGGQAVVEAAGGQVTDLQGRPMAYNCSESLVNPAFLAVADTTVDWHRYVRESQKRQAVSQQPC